MIWSALFWKPIAGVLLVNGVYTSPSKIELQKISNLSGVEDALYCGWVDVLRRMPH